MANVAPAPFQYSIRSLLLLTAATALLLGLGKSIGPEAMLNLGLIALLLGLLFLAGLALAYLEVEVVVGAAVGFGAVLAGFGNRATHALCPLSPGMSCLLAGAILGALWGDLVRDAKTARLLRRRGRKSIRQSLPLPLPEPWMRRTVLIGAAVMVVVFAAVFCTGACWLPSADVWDQAADAWHDCVAPKVEYVGSATAETNWEMIYTERVVPGAYSLTNIFRNVVDAWPITGLVAFSVLASVLAHVKPFNRLGRDHCLWRVGAAHAMIGLIFSLDTMQCLEASFPCSHSFRPAEILESMIRCSACIPINAILLALSLCVLGRHMGRYFRLCGWLLALSFAAAVNAVVVAVGIALLMLC